MKMTPKHNQSMPMHKPMGHTMGSPNVMNYDHGDPMMQSATHAAKDSRRNADLAQAQKGIQSQNVQRGNKKSAPMHVPTVYGNKPVPHK